MLFQIAHISGMTTYLIFFILFGWMSRVPRTNGGAGWWAISALCIFAARLAILLLTSPTDRHDALTAYCAFVLLEKLFFLAGSLHFFNQPVRWPLMLALVLPGEIWVALYGLRLLPLTTFTIGFALPNVVALLWVARASFQQRHDPAHPLALAVALTAAVLALQWSSFSLIGIVEGWRTWGFVSGTLATLILYMMLLGSVLLQFQQRLLAAEEQALELAYHDPLTGLNNQHYMNKLFDKALLLATRPHHLVAVLYIDLDNFKPINDSAGHATGDEVLKIVAGRLKDFTRSTDICARIGGDEFVVVATQLEQQEQAHDIAKKLLQQLTEDIIIRGETYRLGASIGISLYPLHGHDLKELMDNADAAMYQIKHKGKSGYSLYERVDAGN